MRHFRALLYRHGRWLPFFAVLLLPILAFARVGGGEHYNSGSSDDSGGSSSGGGGDGGELAALLIWLVIEHPVIGIPLVICIAIVVIVKRNTAGNSSTQRAFQQREAERRTQVSARDVIAWVGALKVKDPSFDLLTLLDKVKKLFLDVQAAWLRMDLSPVRPFLSDSVFQRLNVQLKLLTSQGVRDAFADVSVNDLQIVGLEQNEFFDTVHIRVKAQMRDIDVPAGTPEAQAVEMAKKGQLEQFTEIWSFVRKPGAQTKIGEDLYQGKCPNCGAPFKGGAANSCEHCGAVVNSGNYDWTLAEITQGIEHEPAGAAADGYAEARQRDPGLNLETLEDRASLVFWKWVDAMSSGDANRLSKVATPQMIDLTRAAGQRSWREIAVGGVTVRLLDVDGGYERAHVEIRWSAKFQGNPVNVPQRWMFTLVRKAGAKTNAGNGMSTNRCPQCNAPLTDSAAPSCDYCGALLSGGEKDWVLSSANTVEAWNAMGLRARPQAAAGAPTGKMVGAGVITDVQERERLLYMMAAMAAADGVVDDRERKLLKMCSERWSVPWANVEMAINAGPNLFGRLVVKGSGEAETFLASLVQMALIDGKVDRNERKMLEAAAQHLGVADKLPAMLGNN